MSIINKVSEFYSQNNLQELEDRIGISFCKKHYLITALSHRSPKGDPLFSKKENKKLALIGDALIDLVVFSSLYPKVTTGKMDDTRQTLATNPKLNTVIRQLGLEKYLFLEDSVDEFILKQSKSLGADTIEALTGAIFLDQGFETAKTFVQIHILSSLKEKIRDENNHTEIENPLEADSVVIELGQRGGDVENLTRATRYLVGGMDAFLDSVARRAKYGFFQGKVISKNHVGWLPKDVVYEGRSGGWDTPYRVAEAKPEGEVLVTPDTHMICKIIIL